MLFAAADWENSARVNFIHRPAEDNNCTNNNANVFFDIRQTSDTSFLARSFLPSLPVNTVHTQYPHQYHGVRRYRSLHSDRCSPT